MKKLELLITQARRNSENEDFSDTTGISDEEVIQFANDAQDKIIRGVSILYPDLYEEEEEIDAVVGQEAYDLPAKTFLGTRIISLEYSPSRDQLGFYPLSKGSKKERISGVQGVPSFYFRRGRKFLVGPTPQQTGIFRVTFQSVLPVLDIRRGKVSSATLTSNQITSLVLDTTLDIDDSALLEEDYITVVDRDGAIKMEAIPITAISTSSGIVTVDPSFTFQSGETISAGDYVVRGPFSTTHSQLEDICQGYLVSYMAWKLLKRDSSNDSVEQTEEMKEMWQEILDSYRDPDGDVSAIPIISGEGLTPEG